MNKLFTKSLIAAGVALSISSATFAAPMVLQDGDRVRLSDSYGTVNAGAFRVAGVGSTVGDSFLTFCLERNEYVSMGTNYFVDISTAANNGGVAGQTSANSDPLSYSSAWLYTQFRNGSLDDGGFSGFTYGTDASMNAVQIAFWFMENELTRSSSLYSSNSLAQSLVSAAQGANWNSLGNVQVMNLYSNYNSRTGRFSGHAQSQLYMTPVPEPETYAMLMAGLGLMGVVARRRKQRAGSI